MYFIRMPEEEKVVNTWPISWALPQSPWGRPRSQLGVDPAQVQGPRSGESFRIPPRLPVISHLLLGGLLEKQHRAYTQPLSMFSLEKLEGN